MMELEGEYENNHFKHENKSLVYGLWARLLVHRDASILMIKLLTDCIPIQYLVPETEFLVLSMATIPQLKNYITIQPVLCTHLLSMDEAGSNSCGGISEVM